MKLSPNFPLYAFWPEKVDQNGLKLTTIISLICVWGSKCWPKCVQNDCVKWSQFFPYMRLRAEKLTRIAINRQNIHRHNFMIVAKVRVKIGRDASPTFSVLRPPTRNLCSFDPFGHGIVTFWCEIGRERGLHNLGEMREDVNDVINLLKLCPGSRWAYMTFLHQICCGGGYCGKFMLYLCMLIVEFV